MDDAIVDDGHFFVAENDRGAILGSGGWSRYRPGCANGLGVGGPDGPTVRSVFVDSAAARRGIASAITLRIERDAAGHEIQTLQISRPRSLPSQRGLQTGEEVVLAYDMACGRLFFVCDSASKVDPAEDGVK